MSMEVYVLSDRRLTSIRDWQRAIDTEGFELVLSNERSFDSLSGHLPARLGRTQAGFECDHWNAIQLMNESSIVDFGHRWKHAIAFRWGGDLDACLGAYMAATAYAGATDGVVLDCQEGKLLTPQQARENVNRMERDLPAVKNAMRKILDQQT
jgi:hypothetical protein